MPVSVQYKCEYTQSTARPSAVTTPEDTTTDLVDPESIGALQERVTSQAMKRKSIESRRENLLRNLF